MKITVKTTVANHVAGETLKNIILFSIDLHRDVVKRPKNVNATPWTMVYETFNGQGAITLSFQFDTTASSEWLKEFNDYRNKIKNILGVCCIAYI